jgi:hypothetical protein
LEAENLEAFADRGYFKGEEMDLRNRLSGAGSGVENLNL